MNRRQITYLTALAQMFDPMAFVRPPAPYVSTCPDIDEKINEAGKIADAERLAKAQAKRQRKLKS